MSRPVFQHDCTKCEFWGHWLSHDIWFCRDSDGGVMGGTIIARYGNDGPDYASVPVRIMFRNIGDPNAVIADGEKTIPFVTWLWTNGIDYYRAMYVALAYQQLKGLMPPHQLKELMP